MNMMPPLSASADQRRWYDRQPELSQCVRLLETFPANIRMILLEGLMYVADREFQAKRMLMSLKSLGPERILGLYKAKSRRREYDKEPLFHEVMSYFYVLSNENRVALAQHARELITHIYRYLEACKLYRQEVALEDIRNLTHHFADQGTQETEKFLKSLQQRLHKQFRSAELIHAAGPDYAIHQDANGMHLRKRSKT
jgi:plasmid stabilization system protein ParE